MNVLLLFLFWQVAQYNTLKKYINSNLNITTFKKHYKIRGLKKGDKRTLPGNPSAAKLHASRCLKLSKDVATHFHL